MYFEMASLSLIVTMQATRIPLFSTDMSRECAASLARRAHHPIEGL